MEMLNSSKPTLQRTFSERLKNLNQATLKRSVSGRLSSRVSFFESAADQVVNIKDSADKFEEYPQQPAGDSSEELKTKAKFDNSGYIVSTRSEKQSSERYLEGLNGYNPYMDAAETRYADSQMLSSETTPDATLSASQYVNSVYSTDDLEDDTEPEEDEGKEEEKQFKKQTLIKSNSYLRTDNYLNYYKNTYGAPDDLEEQDSSDEKESIPSQGYIDSVGNYAENSATAYLETEPEYSSSEEEPEGLEPSLPTEAPKKVQTATPVTTASIGAQDELETMNTTRTLHPLMEKILAFPVRNWQDHLLESYGKTEATNIGKSESNLWLRAVHTNLCLKKRSC